MQFSIFLFITANSTDQNGHIRNSDAVDGDIVGHFLHRRESTSLGINFASSIKPLIFGLNQNNSIYVYVYCAY